MNFQPILPVPLAEDWKIIVRPAVPIQFLEPQPDANSLDTYDYRAGLLVSQDDFGKPALIKLNIIPVVPALMKEPLF